MINDYLEKSFQNADWFHCVKTWYYSRHLYTQQWTSCYIKALIFF